MKTGAIILTIAVLGVLFGYAATSAVSATPAYSTSIECKQPKLGVTPKLGFHKRTCDGGQFWAMFRSNKADVAYSTCIKAPAEKAVCIPAQNAYQGSTYANRYRGLKVGGTYRVTWFVKGKKVAQATVTRKAKAEPQSRSCVGTSQGGSPVCIPNQPYAGSHR